MKLMLAGGWVCAALAVGAPRAVVEACAPDEHIKTSEVAPSRIASQALREDLRILRRALEEIHPGLYRAHTRESLDAEFARTEAYFGQDRTRAEAYVELSRLTATLRCGHTYANPSNQRRDVLAELTHDAGVARPRLPLAMKWIDGRLIVTGTIGAHVDVAPGTEVCAIQGRRAGEILAMLLPLTRADGGNDAKRVAQLDVTGRDAWAPFDLFLPLLVRLPEKHVDLLLRRPGEAEVHEERVPVRSHDDRVRAQKLAEPALDGDAPLWAVQMLDARAALLKMPTWVAYKTKWDWQGATHAMFDRLAAGGVTGLVIDLRGNEGGSDVGSLILSRLIDAPVGAPAGATGVRSPDFARLVRYTQVPEDLRGALDTWDDSFYDRRAQVDARVDLATHAGLLRAGHTGGFWAMKDDAGPAMLAARAPRFAGRVAVLVDASNSSATFMFARACRALGVARLIGEPTGGNMRGINGGAYFFLRLPGSGVAIDVPQIGYFPREPVQPGTGAAWPDAGVEPHERVGVTVEDVVSGRDAALEAARAWVGGR